MKILVVNPNTTASMTAKIGAAARAVAAPGTEIVAVHPDTGPVRIEGYYDKVFAVPGLLEEIRKGEAAGCAAAIIACFDDTGLDAARSLASGPVVGICEAAMHTAALLGNSFSVITTLRRSIPVIEWLTQRYGMSRHCRRVRPGRAAALARFLDYVQGHEHVWLCRRVDIARHWYTHHPPQTYQAGQAVIEPVAARPHDLLR